MFGNWNLVEKCLEMEIWLRKVPKILWFKFSIEKCLEMEILLKNVWKWKFGWKIFGNGNLVEKCLEMEFGWNMFGNGNLVKISS